MKPMAKWAAAALWASCGAMAQMVTGTFGGPTSGKGDSFSANFSCFGTPTCTGIYNGADKISECPNTRIYTSTITITGLDLSHPGPISGTISIAGANTHAGPHNPGADCPYTAPDATVFALPFTGTWGNGSATFTITATDDTGQPFTLTGQLSANVASAPPVFPMAVTGSVTATTTDAEANIQPRTQDAGTSQNVYVFTHAPANLVSGLPGAKATGPQPPIGAAHDDAVVCVLAQVTADGHLIAASASSMQAALSGVLSSQGQTVQLLNNVATSNVAGVTVFVGYGTSASAMFASGVYQAALNVPGPVQCMASLASAPAPTSPAALSGLWWNESESGWGIHFTQRGTNLFAAWYTYDTAGNPKWYVAPNCAFAAANATSGGCTSALYEVDGPTFFGTPFHSPTADQVKNDGTLQLTFQDPSHAAMTYTLGSFTRTVPIVRQLFNVAQSPAPAVDYTDLWWDSDESGWGMAITHQFGNIFLAWYVYDANGKPFWYVAPACTVEGSGCSGTLYRTTGPAFGPPLDPTKVQAASVGTAIVSFIDANNAVLSYTVNGVSGTKAIKRQLF